MSNPPSRKSPTGPAPAKSGSAMPLSRDDIATHIARFQRNGGVIEVLGTTPLRPARAPAAGKTKSKS